jgi:hypothetical protein
MLDTINASITSISANKVDKEDGKSLIDAEYAAGIHYVDNPEFIEAKVDAEDKVLEGIQKDGTKVIGGDLKVLGNMEVSGVSYKVIENPEYLAAWVDAEEKVIFGFKTDGGIYYGAGCPQQIIDYIDGKLAELSLDEYEDIVAFLSDYLGGDTTLKSMLDTINASITSISANKVDKEDGKSLIDAEYAAGIHYVDNPEFIEAKVDAEDKFLEGIQKDGTKVIGGDLKVLGNMEVSGVSYKVIENPEYLAAWVDAEDKVIFGFKTDGKTYVGDADFLNEIKNNQEAINEIKSYLANFDSLDIDALSSITAVENLEFIEAKTDAEGKLLAGRTPNGAAFENVGLTTPKVSIDGTTVKNIEDPEGRSEITTDSEGSILSCRDKDGILHENVGIETPVINTGKLTLSDEGLDELQHDLEEREIMGESIKYYLPKFSTTNIKQETFYLQDTGWSDYDEDVELRQLYDDTVANAYIMVTISRFFHNNTPLLFFPASLVKEVEGSLVGTAYVKKIDGVYYYVDTLGVDHANGDRYIVLEYSMQATVEEQQGEEVTSVAIPVKEVVDIPPVNAWAVTKEYEHHCIVDIDFGSFLTKSNIPMGVKFQGAGTVRLRKRNFRFTFYKNNTYKKKDKIKIGEMLRLSGYNLKANFSDDTRMRELFVYRLVSSIWLNRPITDRLPWDNDAVGTYFNGATGNIQGFPIEVNVGGSFYGLDCFCLKKDEKNYCLDGDDDSSGIFVNSDGGTWINASPIDWGDELGVKDRTKAYPYYEDSVSIETAEALQKFFDFINSKLYTDGNGNDYKASDITEIDEHFYVTSTLVDGQPGVGTIEVTAIGFNATTIPDRMDVIGFIDYFIILQVFIMWDNTYRNVILFSKSDKKKIYPFFYDVNSSLYGIGETYDGDIFTASASLNRDMSLWTNLIDIYWDQIVNRYFYLRKNFLNENYIDSLKKSIIDNIPTESFAKENSRWGSSISKKNFDAFVALLNKRLGWLDENYFNV